MASPIKVSMKETGDVDNKLLQLPEHLRKTALRPGVRRAGTAVAREARRLVPVGKGPAEGRRRLRRTITTKVKIYGNKVVAFVGPRYGTGLGNHGHLVEFGHVIKRKTPGLTFTRPRPFMRPAADNTIAKQSSEIIDGLEIHLRELAKPKLHWPSVTALGAG